MYVYVYVYIYSSYEESSGVGTLGRLRLVSRSRSGLLCSTGGTALDSHSRSCGHPRISFLFYNPSDFRVYRVCRVYRVSGVCRVCRVCRVYRVYTV